VSARELAALAALAARGSAAWLGLMSGNSADGIDAARVELEETSGGARVRSVRGETFPFPPEFSAEFRRVLESPGDFATAARFDRILGERFAAAAERAIERFGPVDAIAVSGHTFSHRPADEPPSTLQLGSACFVAERTGLPVLAGFRAADLARGGEGAPLVPAGDRVLFGGLAETVAVVNIGGISNATWLEHDAPPRAADAGPGNLLLDGAYRRGRPGGGDHDDGGEIAASGRADPECLARWSAAQAARSDAAGRRSFGREEFGAAWLERERDGLARLSLPDRLRTLCAWIADEIARTTRRLGGGRTPERLLVGGGGARNRTLLAEIARAAGQRPEPLEAAAHGVDLHLREAAAFAILGHEWLYGRPGSFPGTTGTGRAAPLGTLYLPGRGAPR
jgi:anhydro-N-acetylmuramic acid kinase